MKINFSKTEIQSKDIKLVSKIINSGWLTHGRYSKLFEEEIKKYTKAKYCTLVSSCTAALHISCIAAGFKKGDEVIVPAMSHTATSHAVEYTGAKVKFADINFETGNIEIDNLKKVFSGKTKGLIVVHMTGVPCNMKKIKNFCISNRIKLIEDCAHGLGTKFNNIHVGNFGLAGCFSFYPTKQITTGEGGALITNDQKIYKKVKRLKAFGIDKDLNERKKPGEYDVKLLGLNYRMTDFQAGLGLMQIKRYKANLKKRHILAKKYISKLQKSKNIIIPKFNTNYSYFIFQILFKNINFKNKIMEIFKKQKIGISVHYGKALPMMTYYKKRYNLSKSFPNALKYSKSALSLPMYPKLKFDEIDKITNLILKYCK